MKKIRKLAVLLLAVMAALTACAKKEEAPAETGQARLFSNLYDEKSKKEVREALKAAGVSQSVLDSFFEQVDYFNGSLDGYGLTKDGFKEAVSVEPKYDPYEMQDIWMKKNPDFLGYNCRITSYGLMRDWVTLDNSQPPASDYLVFDLDAIKNSPVKLFDNEELKTFQTLFASVPTENTKDLQTHLDKVQEYWKSKQVAFKEGDVSLISVFFHDEEGFLFIGHVGVLVPDADGSLIFIEKVAFQEPYQAINFKDRADLSRYLMEKYNVEWGQETAKPFVMENDALMEGYEA